MASQTCKRYIVVSMEGEEPFMTDNAALIADFMENDWYYVIDTQTAAYADPTEEEQWSPIPTKELQNASQ